MSQNWPTKEKDMRVAAFFMENYAQDKNYLSVFELCLNQEEKRFDFRPSNWVLALAYHFVQIYGQEQGSLVTRNVIGDCLRNGETLH